MSYKVKIPYSIRKQIWLKYNGDTIDNGKCFVCQMKLSYDQFECGHVIPESLGGACIADNLRPVCKKCNSDMGQMNLDLYIKLGNLLTQPISKIGAISEHK